MNLASRASVLQGLSAMAGNPLRTVLSTLGVVMGIASVISTLSLANGLERFSREQLAAQTDIQAVAVSSRTQIMRDGFAFPNRQYPIFGLRDAEELQRYVGVHGAVTMTVSGQTTITTPTAPMHAAVVTASLANYLILGEKAVAAGRYFTDVEVEHNAPVVVLSYKLARELSPDGVAETMVGREIRVRGRAMTAVGVMPPYTGENTFQIFIPLRAAPVALGAGRQLTPTLFVHAPRLEDVDATRDLVIDWIASRFRDWDRQVLIQTSLLRLEQARTAMLIFKVVMAAFASIALVVGGVGIMNVLLASVTERTREIGIRKALGARKRDILYQFLAESVAVSSLGAGVGTVVGFTAAFGVAAIVRKLVPGTTIQAAVTPATLYTAIISAVTIGLTFGLLPALRAARLSPIDAIHHE